MTARRLCHGSVGHVPMTLGTWPLSDKCSGRPVQASARYAGQAREQTMLARLRQGFAASDLPVTGGSAGALTVRRGQRLDPRRLCFSGNVGRNPVVTGIAPAERPGGPVSDAPSTG